MNNKTPGRLSRTAPWERRGEIPLHDPITCKRCTEQWDNEIENRTLNKI